MIGKAFKNIICFILIASFYFLFHAFIIVFIAPWEVHILEACTENFLLIREHDQNQA